MRCLFTSALALLATTAPAHADDDDELPPLSVYGSARLDMLVNDSQMSGLDDATFVRSEKLTGETDGDMTMTPRLSRLGLGIDQWDLAGGVITGEGKLEIDFAGRSGANTIRLRHAYGAVTAGRRTDRVQLLAGQTDDLVAPLIPAAQNDGQLRHAGNLGDRRAQLRVTTQVGKRVQLAIAGAAPSTDDRRDLDGDGMVDAMMAGGKPMAQWSLEYRGRFPTSDDDASDVVRLGVSGHVTASPQGEDRAAASIAGHFFLPVAPRLVVLGEAYLGNDLADLGGGIGQGRNPMTNRMVHASGGWVELATMPTRRHLLAAGTSIDVARSADLQEGDRKRNGTVYSVLRYRPKPTLQFGLEHLYWRTEYKNATAGVANRVDVHFSVLF